MGKDIKEKKNLWILVVCIITVAVAATVLVVFREKLFNKKEEVNYGNAIAIERIDGQDSLRMPYKYIDKILMDKLLFQEEIELISISSVNFEVSEEGIRWGMSNNGLVNTGDKDALKILGGIKYCKGITDTSSIINEKGNSSVIFYEGYSEQILTDSSNDYVIIPSSMIRYINDELTSEEKVMTLRHSSESNSIGQYKIIGEYTTKDEYDTIYVSYSSMVKLLKAAKIEMSEYVDTLLIILNEGKDYTKLIEYLEEYFADADSLEKYEGKINMFDDPYIYQFVHYSK